MQYISQTFHKLGVQVIYFMMIPLFFVVFALVYHPFDIDDFLDMGKGMFAFNITMITCIVLVTLVITRLTFYFLRKAMHLPQGWYIFWCCCEVVIIAHFVTLYMWLMLSGTMTYLQVLGNSLPIVASVVVYPYIIIGLAVRLSDAKKVKPVADENTRMRFYDDKNNLKLVVASENVLYIEAKENYIQIHYIERGRLMSYQLRCTMKSIEELCDANGLLRCHRSFFINKEHVRLLRKDKDGIILAELDSPQSPHIPVSKRYYDGIANLL